LTMAGVCEIGVEARGVLGRVEGCVTRSNHGKGRWEKEGGEQAQLCSERGAFSARAVKLGFRVL